MPALSTSHELSCGGRARAGCDSSSNVQHHCMAMFAAVALLQCHNYHIIMACDSSNSGTVIV